jgi:hypothetical protein
MTRYDEADAQRSGIGGGTFYREDLLLSEEEARLRGAPHIIRLEDQVWEDSPQGRLRHIANAKLNPHARDIDAYIQQLPPDGRSGRARRMAEQFVFFLEGAGYSLHWDVELAEMRDSFVWRIADVPHRFSWEAGDWMFVPINTVVQHFNSSGDEPARLLTATSNVYKFLGAHEIEQLENAPGYQG